MSPALIFDCDGVLVDSEVLALEIERAALTELGLTYDLAEYKRRFLGMSSASYFTAIEADSREKLGKPLPPDLREAMKAQYDLAMAERLAEIAGAREVLLSLPHPKAVASSSTVEQLKIKLSRAGLWDIFAPHVYAADHVRHAKPAPDLFLHAANALGAQPAACVVLEDSANGVLAAKAAGMRVFGFMGGGHMDAECGERLLAHGAERLVASWAEAGRLLSAL